jgi:hypothetical protein
MNVTDLYNRYVETYRIELRECSTSNGVKLLKEIDMLEDLTLDQFKERLEEPNFNAKWGDDSNHQSNFMYNWIRNKSGK